MLFFKECWCSRLILIDCLMGAEIPLRIGAVGGGQEPNETILGCAIREAEEKLSVQKVELLPAPVTFFSRYRYRSIQEIGRVDTIAPLLFQCQTKPVPNTQYKQELQLANLCISIYSWPISRFYYYCSGDDVVALLLVPINKWEILERDFTIGTIITCNKQSDVLPSISKDTRLFL